MSAVDMKMSVELHFSPMYTVGMNRTITFITHVAAQTLYYSLPRMPPAEMLWHDGDPVAPFEQWSLGQWCAFTAELLASGPYAWLTVWRRIDPTGKELAAHAYRHAAAVRQAGGHIMTIVDDEYPKSLAEISDPPLALTLLGDISLLKREKWAVIGARKASARAVEMSFSVSRDLALRGVVVVSGGALGCDGAAHQGVLASGVQPAPTIVVLAGGLSAFYPQRHHQLFTLLRSRGALFVSERLWFAPARAVDFPIRNRLISGLSEGVCLMQAAERSGAMVTARMALDQGRDLVVYRHGDGDIRGVGSERLIEDGAPHFSDWAGWLAVAGFGQDE